MRVFLFLFTILTSVNLVADSLEEHLKKFKNLEYEGHVDQDQIDYFTNLIQENPDIKVIAEIGFYAGNSSEVFLEARDDVIIYSFDIGTHNTVTIGKKFLDKKYPGRHSLILGNSLKTVPQFHCENPDIKFDLIFIDGGHLFKEAYFDIFNMKACSHEKTILVMDDLVPQFNHGKGPTRAWNLCKKKGIVEEIGIFASTTHPKKWAEGKYVF